jgi:hypothetical protein
VKPKYQYYKFGLAEKLLFLSKVDKIDYDIIDNERRRKASE